MVKVKRMMETDANGIQRQIYPMTDVSAIRGLQKIMSGGSQVISVNGKVGAVTITKDDLGLGDVATGSATNDKPGYIIVGDLLDITPEGVLSARIQSDYNFTEKLKTKLDALKLLTPGANVSISEDGVISATGGGEGGGVNQEYVDHGDQATLEAAKEYANTLKNFTFEKVGEVNG